MLVGSIIVVLIALDVHAPAHVEGGGGLSELRINGSVGENVRYQ